MTLPTLAFFALATTPAGAVPMPAEPLAPEPAVFEPPPYDEPEPHAASTAEAARRARSAVILMPLRTPPPPESFLSTGVRVGHHTLGRA